MSQTRVSNQPDTITTSNGTSASASDQSMDENTRYNSVSDFSVVSAYSSKRSYVTVGILCFINLINYMDRYTLAGVLTDVIAYYKLSNSEAGLLQTCFVVSYMIMAPLFGYMGDRYNRRFIMAVGVAFWSITTLLGSFVPSNYFIWFILLRGLVGTGEASYSTIAPTLIADLFSGSARTRMLSLFYFAIPVGSGLGYIVGSEVAKGLGHWYWALRITPSLGLLSVVLTLFVLVDPPRGEAEGGTNLKNTNVFDDIIQVLKIPSFMWVTLGFTCVTFSIGALAWWVPDFMVSAIQSTGKEADKSTVSLVFGVITCIAGIAGVILGTVSAQVYRKYNPRADPLICAYSMLTAVPLVFTASLVSASYLTLSYVLMFFGVTLLCMNWVLVADITMYVVIPTRRSMAAAIQITLSHALGDACSPYVVGTISDSLREDDTSPYIRYKSMQYALFLPVFVLVLGVVCFLVNSFYVVEDKDKCKRETQESCANLDVETVVLLKDVHYRCDGTPVLRLSNHAGDSTPDSIYQVDPDTSNLIIT